MANSGIMVEEELKLKVKGMINEGKYAWVKLEIVDEKEIKLTGQQESTGDFGADYNAMAESMDLKSAAFFVVRLKNEKEYLFVPNNAKVRTKMIYTSTVKNTMKGLEGINFAGNYKVFDMEDFTYENFDFGDEEKAKQSKLLHLSAQEKMLEDEKYEAARYSSAALSTGKSVAFPVSEELKGKIDALKSGKLTFVCSKVKGEDIVLDSSGGSVDELKLPAKEPRFVLFNFAHEHEGEKLKSIAFLYVCPEAAKVRQKMLFSSTKQNFLGVINEKGILLDRSIETSNPKEVSEKWLYDELHPKKLEKKVQFKRVKPRGGRRRRPKKVVI